MNTTTVRTRFVPVLALLVFALSAATSSALACVVGTGTSASCTGAALDACLPGGASFDGTVTFACGGAATITLGSRKIISADTTIDGGGVITISGPLNTGPGGTGFSLTSSGVTFTVENLTIANGRALVGGAINNMRGTLIVTNSTFSGNSSPNGGAIVNGAIGTLIVTNSNFSSNHGTFGGGAILNGGTATVTNSSFSANSSSTAGGAISNLNFLIVTNSTFSGNSVSGDGGAIANGGPLTVTNSTFSGNSATFGGGAIYGAPASVTLVNSILADSTSGGNCGGTIADGGHNLDDGTTCGFTGTGCATTTGTSFCNTNPLLDPAGLASNGGPTQTIALEAMSPAINAGNETVCAAPPVNNLVQRGFVRPGMGATNCSVGAYEFAAAPPSSTTTATSTTTSTTRLTTTTTNTTTSHPTTTTSTSTTTTSSSTSTSTTTTTRAPTTTTTTSTTTTTTHVTTTTICASTCINPGVGTAGSCTVLELAAGEVAVKVAVTGGPGGIDGDVCIGPNGNLSITGAQFVTGNVRLASGATLRKTGPGSIGGVLRDQDLDEEITDAMSAATDAAALPCTQMFASLNTSQVIVGAGGQNVLCVGDVILNGGRVVTLSGDANDTFIVNVTGRFALTGGSKIVASGVLPSAILYNIVGTGPAVALNGGASIDGTLLAVDRDIALTPSLVSGEVIGGQNISITGNASVRCRACAAP